MNSFDKFARPLAVATGITLAAAGAAAVIGEIAVGNNIREKLIPVTLEDIKGKVGSTDCLMVLRDSAVEGGLARYSDLGLPESRLETTFNTPMGEVYGGKRYGSIIGSQGFDRCIESGNRNGELYIATSFGIEEAYKRLAEELRQKGLSENVIINYLKGGLNAIRTGNENSREEESKG